MLSSISRPPAASIRYGTHQSTRPPARASRRWSKAQSQAVAAQLRWNASSRAAPIASGVARSTTARFQVKSHAAQR